MGAETKLLRNGGFSGSPIPTGARSLIYVASHQEVEGVSGKYFSCACDVIGSAKMASVVDDQVRCPLPADERERDRESKPGGLTRGGGNALAFKLPTWPYDIESGPGGRTREVERPLPSNSPHDHMILREDLVDSHGRWKRPCLQTAHMTI